MSGEEDESDFRLGGGRLIQAAIGRVGGHLQRIDALERQVAAQKVLLIALVRELHPEWLKPKPDPLETAARAVVREEPSPMLAPVEAAEKGPTPDPAPP